MSERSSFAKSILLTVLAVSTKLTTVEETIGGNSKNKDRDSIS
jgi:hypothetical protein